MFNGTKIENMSSLSINLIGTTEMALICKTNKTDCCASQPNRYGEWYYANRQQIQNMALSIAAMSSFFRDRTDNGEVRLNKDSNGQITPGPGMYCCEIPESDANCGITQRLCVNLGENCNYYISCMYQSCSNTYSSPL